MRLVRGAGPGEEGESEEGESEDRRADSAGVPWAGRTLRPQRFDGDDGTGDPGLEAALGAWAAGGALADVVAAWAPTRVLVPVVAVLGEGDELVPVQGDKSADMALAVLTGRDGRRALPAFTSVASLARWDPASRPVPVEAARAALAAVAERCDAVVIDAAGPLTCVLPRPAVWAVAQGRAWVHPAEDGDVVAAVAAACAPVPEVLAHRCEAGDGAALEVVLGLRAGLGPEATRAAAGQVARTLGESTLVGERVEAVHLRLRVATS